jgi:CHASE2 domain-containing sensor protein
MAMEDVQFNDIYYSTRIYQKPNVNEKITLINTGSIKNDSLFRYNLASLINKIGQLKPKNIGLDLIFEKHKNKQIDSLLKKSIDDNEVVTVLDYKNQRKNIFNNHKKGFSNFPGKVGETQREYYNYIILNNDTIPSFATALTKIRNENSKDYLKYSTNESGFYNLFNQFDKVKPENFPSIEASDILNGSNLDKIKNAIQNKYVIIGHLGSEYMENEFDSEDKFRVPTDESLFNRNLIMPGAVIHANAALMLLNGDYLYHIEGWQQEFITDFILFGFLFLFYTIHHKFHLKQ